MQAVDSYSVPRRNPDFEDFIDIARRHKTWILGPFWAGIVVSTVVAFLWPDTFISSALVRVTSSQVPERFVPANVNQMLSDRINAIAQGVLSRSTLTNIIQTHDLYPRERRRLPIDDIVERMRTKDIRIGAVNLQQGQSRVGAFPISFQYENRYLAQKVTADLVSRLINENERETLSQSQQTTDFLTQEVDKAKVKLDEIEARLASFKVAHAGTLENEQQTNIGAMNSLDQRLSTVNTAISRVNQDKALLESNLRIYKDQLAKAVEAANAPPEVTRGPAKSEELLRREREIMQLEQTLLQYKELYKDTHPNVQRLQSNLELLRRQKDALAKSEEEAQKKLAADSTKSPRKQVINKEIQTYEANIKQIETMIQSKNLEIQDLNSEVARLNGQIRTYQSRIMASPVAAQQYAQIARDYEQAKLAYNKLKNNQDESARGTAIIKNKQGETLDLLDQASLPVTPAQPNRPLIIGAGAIIGLLLGVVLVGVREMKDTTLKNLKDVRAYTQLTVLGCVPLLEDDIVVKRRRRMGLLGWTTGILVGVLVMGGAVAYYMVTTT